MSTKLGNVVRYHEKFSLSCMNFQSLGFVKSCDKSIISPLVEKTYTLNYGRC